MAMTDREFRKQRRRVRKAFRRLSPALGLGAWFIELRFHRGVYEIDGVMSTGAVASAKVRWEYRQATIEFDLEQVSGHSDLQLENIIVHEAMHVHLREMREDDPDLKHEERVATSLQWMVQWARKRGVA